ncbi:MAG: hypothetical protein EXR50_02285 [Dehalococcoidia bacterium]|nr:hypothetical protein [Dehalococcoidia bacterium]
MHEIETRIFKLKETLGGTRGTNVANQSFTKEVDDLISAIYDDIGEIKNIGLRSLFDLFIIKTLYVERGSTDPDVIEYLSELMAGFLLTREMLPVVRDRKRYGLLISDILEEMRNLTHFQNLFEAYRKMGDYSLFLTGIFPASVRSARRRYGRWMKAQDVPMVDLSYHTTSGKIFYLRASEHDLAEATNQRTTLAKLSRYFNIYMDALHEMSDKYVLGFDMGLIADKMLDSFNSYRVTGDKKHLEDAQKYAAILKVDRAAFPGLFRTRRRPRYKLI